jgi:hypothetical protein
MKHFSTFLIIFLTSAYYSLSAQSFIFENIHYAVLSESGKTVQVSGMQNMEIGENINIPEKVTYNSKEYIVTAIGDSAFMWHTGLKSISLPLSVTAIGKFAFKNCSNLTALLLPDNLTTIGIYAFSGSGLTTCIIPAGVTTIEDDAFSNCVNLTDVTLPAELTNVSNSMFNGCTHLKSIVVPQKVSKIGMYAFEDCSELESVSLQDNLTLIDNGAFMNCVALRSMQIPDNVTRIGENAFYGCSALQTVDLSTKTSLIMHGAFANCSSLTAINVAVENTNYTTTEGVLFTKSTDDKMLLVYPAAKSDTTYSIPTGVSRIAASAFAGSRYLKNVTFPVGITFIGESAFENCKILESVSLQTGITEIQNSTFSGCTTLTSALIPVGVTRIGETAFKNTALISLVVPTGVKEIGSGAFSGCQSLNEIRLPQTLDSIDNLAFYENIGLSKIQILNTTPPIVQANSFEQVNTSTVMLEVPMGSALAYRSAPGWDKFVIINEVNFEVSTPTFFEQSIRILPEKGKLRIEADKFADITIVNIEGKIYFKKSLPVGNYTIALPTGIYITTINNKASKILIE